jgi:HSP20 family molecular chaperone IbpA
MNKTILYSLAAGLGLCLTLIAWLAWSNWQLQQQIATLSDNNVEPEPDWLQRLAPATPQNQAPANLWDPGWDPFAELDRMQQQMDHMMQSSLFNMGAGMRGSQFNFQSAQPDFRVEEDDDAYYVHITVPEGSELELSSQLDGQTLTVSGTVTSSQNNSANGMTRNFRRSSQFTRQIPLGKPVDSLAMSTESDGQRVLITLPKA